MRAGIVVYCQTCGLAKAPHGRDVAAQVASSYCFFRCPGYDRDPQVGDLWPGETEEEFGYPVRDAGTVIRWPLAAEEPR